MAGVDPLGSENDLLFSCGLLTGTAAPAPSRLHVGARGLLGSSNVGGHLGAELRAAGVQVLRIRGRARRPVMLQVGPVRLATPIVASEHRVRYACIMTGTPPGARVWAR